MSSELRERYARLKDGSADAAEFLNEVALIDDRVDALLGILQGAYAAQDWKAIPVLMWAVQRYPDKRFTGVLCQLLDSRIDNSMESVVDAMDEVADEHSVESLINAINYLVPGDGGMNVNKKIIYALSRIGTASAIEGIKEAFRSDEPVIKEIAGSELHKLSVRTAE